MCWPLEKQLISAAQIQTFGNYLLHESDKAAVKRETTIFKSVGMALFDLAVSRVIYEKALEKGLGQAIEL